MAATKAAQATCYLSLLFLLLIESISACKLLNEKPAFDVSEIKNFTDAGQQILVKFGGHFKYTNFEDLYGPVSYVPIRVDSISLKQSKLHRSLQMDSDCAKVTMSIINDKWGTMVTGIKVDLALPNDGTTWCELDYYFLKMWSPVSEHYYCTKARSLGCHDGGKNGRLVGVLVVEYLEFETDGDPKLFEQGQFASDRHDCQ